jgi:hypothetical protein
VENSPDSGRQVADVRPFSATSFVHRIGTTKKPLIQSFPKLIKGKEKSLQSKIEAFEKQREELRKHQLSEAQIDHIAPRVSQVEVDATQADVAGLKAEAEALQRFLADAPRFNISLLKDTAIDPCHVLVTEAAA